MLLECFFALNVEIAYIKIDLLRYSLKSSSSNTMKLYNFKAIICIRFSMIFNNDRFQYSKIYIFYVIFNLYKNYIFSTKKVSKLYN